MTNKIHILGSGTPTPTPERYGSAFALDLDGELVMVDCGPAATWKLAKAGLRVTDVDHLFFTHHHFDHDVDYPCFLLTRWDQSIGAERELRVYGPPPTAQLTDQLIGPAGAFTHDYHARINWTSSQRVHMNRGGTLPRKPPNVRAEDIQAGFVLESETWTVRAAEAAHAQPYLDCLSYRFDTSAGSVVVTGDTEPCPAVQELATGADVLLCMSWDTEENMARTGEGEGCCGVESAARMARDARVETLVLVHTGPRLSTQENTTAAIELAGTIHDGPVIFAEELTVVNL